MNWQAGLYVAAVLIPLAAFTVQILFIRRLKRLNAYIATAAIGLSCALSAIGFLDYVLEADGVLAEHHAAASAHAEGGGEGRRHGPLAWAATYDWVLLGSPTPGGADPLHNMPLSFPLGVRIDNLSAVMFLMVTFIATLIHLYSIGYMHDDSRFPRFFAYLSLFCFSMLGLIAATNLFMIFIFWELVGLCSYLLIGFWYEEKPNADAANKAFVVNRVGDVGMLVGLGLLWGALGTFDFQEINAGLHNDATGAFNVVGEDGRVVEFHDPHAPVGAPARRIPFWMLTVAGLGVFAGCAGKSAQFPLHVWLPDAMAGPTPVSALIHAATMVAAGVYLVARFFPLFTPDVLLYIAYTGGVTLFIAATIAVVQSDYKKVLAYSTISQLGFMMLAIGVGGRAAGMFHLVTHAFFKALLFLCAGSVYHSVHTYEMAALGGLRKKMPITATAMLIGTLAISGVPFFSGFYSKDAILASAIARVAQSPRHFLLFALPAVGAAVTAFYMFRMWFLVFAGEPRGFRSEIQAVVAHVKDEETKLAEQQDAHGHGADVHDQDPAAHAHESPPIMTVPLMILSFFAVVVGWTLLLGLPVGVPILERIIAYGEPLGVINAHESWIHWYAVASSLTIAVVGIGLGLLYYAPPGLPFFPSLRLDPRRAAESSRGLYTLFKNKWYIDEIYGALMVRPSLAAARFLGRVDKLLVDGVVNGSAWLTERFSRWNGLFDNLGVDGVVNGLAALLYYTGDRGREIQTGKLRNYLMFLAAALVGLFAGVFAWVGGGGG